MSDGQLAENGEERREEGDRCAESLRYTCRTATPLTHSPLPLSKPPVRPSVSPSPALPSFLQFGLKIVPWHASGTDIAETLSDDFEILEEDPCTILPSPLNSYAVVFDDNGAYTR